MSLICTEWERCDSSSRDWPTPVAVDMDQSVYDSESYDMSHSKESESSGTLYLGWMKGVDSQNQPSESNSSVPHSHEVSEEEMSSQSEEGSSLGEHPMGTSSMLDDADLLNESTVAPLSSSSEIPSEMSESGDEEPVQQESNENQVSITEVKEQNNLLRTLLHEVRQGGLPQQPEFHFSTCDDDLSGPLSDTHYAFTVAEEKAAPVSDEAAETHRVLVALDSAIESSRLTDMDSLSASPSWGESPKASEEASPKEAPKESPKESPRESPRESPKESPKASEEASPKESPRESPRESLKEEENPLDWSVLKEEEGDYVKSVFMRAEDSMMECEASPKEEEEREKEACVKEEEWRMSDLSDSVIVSDESEEEVEEKKSEECVVESEESVEKNECVVEKQKSEECVVESEESDGDVMENEDVVEKQKSECVIEKTHSEECVVESEESASAGSREDSEDKEDTEDSVQEEVRVEEEKEKEPSLTPLAEPEEEEMPSDSVSEEEKISYSVSEEEKPSSSLSEEEKPSESASEEEKPESTSEEEKHSNSVSEECIDLISDSSSNASPAPIPPTIPSPILPFPDPDAPAEQPQSPPPFYNNDAFKPRFTLDQINETLSVFDTVSTKRPAVVATEAEQASEEVESKLKQRESAGEK